MRKRRIIDQRNKEKFPIDDEYINGYAKHCTVYGTAVYNSLCRHADKDQFSFPSMKLMGEQHGCNTKSIMKGINRLEEYNIIQVHRQRDKGGRWKNNGYILVDKSEWKELPSPREGHGTMSTRGTSPSPSDGLDHVHEKDNKDTHNKEAHNKELTEAEASRELNKEVQEVFDYFYKNINPHIPLKHPAQWNSGRKLIEKYGKEKVINAAKAAKVANADKYGPTITTVNQLERNFAKLVWYYKKKEGSIKGIKI